MKDFDKKARTTDYNSRHESYQNDTRGHQMGQREMKTYTNIVICCPLQVINKNKLRWFGYVMRREEESVLRVVMKLKMKGNRPRKRPRLMWLEIIDSNLKGKNTSLKEVLETKCFENRKYWRKLISYSTDRSSEEDPRTPTRSMVSR